MSASLRILRRALVLACLVVGGAWANAAAPPAGAERWTGLGDVVFSHPGGAGLGGAMAIAQDGSGLIWVGTQSGLARWDGYRRRLYTVDGDRPGSLPDNFIRCLHVDRDGRLWVGTNTRGLLRYDPVKDVFVAPAGPAAPARTVHVGAMTDDGQGGLWAATDGGLVRVDADDRLERPSLAGLPAGGVDAVARTGDGALWVVAQSGALLRRGAGSTAFAPVRLERAGAPPVSASLLTTDRAGRLWIGTPARGVFVVQAGEARAEEVLAHDGHPLLPTERVGAMVEALPGEMWFGTEGGIVAYATEARTGYRIRHGIGPNTETTLASDAVSTLFRDANGLVWAGGDPSLSVHDPSERTTVTLLGENGRADGITSADVPYVLSRPDGRVWLGTANNGVDIVDPIQGRIGRLAADAAHPATALPRTRIMAMAETADGADVFVATRLGIYLASTDGRRVRRVTWPGRDPTAAVWSLCVDGTTLWLGGLDGLWKLDVRDADRPVLLRHDAGSGFGDRRVTAILRGDGDSLWVGTQSGLVHVDARSGAVEPVPDGAADPGGMPSGLVSSLLLDRKRRLWLTSFGNGVVLMTGRDAGGALRFRRFGVRDGLPHSAADKILEDGAGRLWVSTDDGLAVIDGATFAIRALQRPEGVALPSYWSNAGTVTSTGELLFGGLGGLVVVRPERLTRSRPEAPIVVTAARVASAVPGSVPALLAGGTRWNGPPLEVPPGGRGLGFEFAALDYAAPERNRYAYRLDGLDTDWTTSDASSRLASYAYVPPGDYTLQLRGSNHHGDWSAPLQIPIRVLPAWFQTAAFRVAVALLAVLAIAALVQARTALLRRRQRELEGLVAARTQELERRTEELSQSRRELEALAYADPLTGLPNRRLFTEDLRRQAAQATRDARPCALLLIDLDGFKSVNDTAGHGAGDALLCATARRLEAAVREGDRVARLGGDEFAVVLAGDVGHDAVDPICDRIVAALGAPVGFEGATLQVGASIGIAVFPDDGATPDRLYKAADQALYAAKRGGRATWRWHTAAEQAEARSGLLGV